MHAIVFLTCDIIALVVQAVGGAMASTEADKIHGDTKPGTNIMMAAMIVFTVLVLDFMRRVFVKTSYLESKNIRPAHHGSLPRSYIWLLVSVFISLTMIFIRSIYRTIELIQGREGYLITHEGFFIGLDAATTTIVVGIFNFFDPVCLLWGLDNKQKQVCEENELSQMDADDERWEDSATVTDRE
ncbi:hypothetical protein BFJ66_g17301 [Fusarium oxysporum f. sp. cepae]|nr:hypothetical protein BFJ67_g17225 [Fusarium oxysporum f. sp. cepae]RKK23928.1 hypothetical protein BFJ66_g17301 [Fusarium oxysporum f. sp. cepae]